MNDPAGARHGNDVVNIGRDSDLPAGERADSVVSILGSSSSAGDAARRGVDPRQHAGQRTGTGQRGRGPGQHVRR